MQVILSQVRYLWDIENKQMANKKKRRFTWFSLAKWAVTDGKGINYDTEERSEVYDQIAIDYFHRDRLAKFLVDKTGEWFPGKKDIRICERAAGGGIVTNTFYDAGYQNIRVSDISKTQLDVLSEKLPNIKTIEEDINTKMPDVGDDEFDLMLEVGATRYMTRSGQQVFIKEAKRALAEGGLLLWPVMLVEMPLTWVKKGMSGPVTSPWGIKKLLENEGFFIKEMPFLWHGKMGIIATYLLVAENGREGESRVTKRYRKILK